MLEGEEVRLSDKEEQGPDREGKVMEFINIGSSILGIPKEAGGPTSRTFRRKGRRRSLSPSRSPVRRSRLKTRDFSLRRHSLTPSLSLPNQYQPLQKTRFQ